MKNLVLILIVGLGFVFCCVETSFAGEKITVKVTNPLKESRSNETISDIVSQ